MNANYDFEGFEALSELAAVLEAYTPPRKTKKELRREAEDRAMREAWDAEHPNPFDFFDM